MSRSEWILFAVALVVIVSTFAVALWRTRGLRSAKLPEPMILVLRITLGIILAILGVIGSLLPIMQGWLFFLLSALVLFPQSRFAIKALDKVERRMPRFVGWLRRLGIGVPTERRPNER